MNLRNVITIVSLSAVLGGVGACTNPEVPAGHEGYIYYKPLIFSKMEYRESLRGPASTGVSWRLYAVVVDMRARSFNEHFELLTKDNLKLSFEVNTRIQPKDGQVKTIVEDWGADHWYDWNVKEPLRTIVRETVTEHKATEIQLDTPDVRARIEAKVREKYSDSPFMILSVDIGDIQFPDLLAQAIQKKIAKNEDLKRQEFVLEKAKKEAAITVLGALRVAEQQRIISSTLDPLYVQRKAVEVYRELGKSQNKTVFVLPNTAEGTGMPLVMSKGARKVLSAADEKLLADMEDKYMAMASRAGPSLMDDPTKPAPTPDADAPNDGAPAPAEPAPADPAPATPAQP
jgi:regulator of protease activity HflC (stomatin/prohibitin superfamily)